MVALSKWWCCLNNGGGVVFSDTFLSEDAAVQLS